MRLKSVYGSCCKDAYRILYELLAERTEDQSISHHAMPSYQNHVSFVESHPYKAWYLIYVEDEVVGSIYLSKQREVGLFIFNKYAGNAYGKEALATLQKFWPGKMLANVNPRNERSIEFFTGQGFKHIQNTYAIR